MRSVPVTSYLFEFFDPTQPDMTMHGISSPEPIDGVMEFYQYSLEGRRRILLSGVKMAQQVAPRFTSAVCETSERLSGWQLR